ncbi:MAG: mechanosensitive ion channel family protein [Candidatus Nealsonbacteria bacterium]
MNFDFSKILTYSFMGNIIKDYLIVLGIFVLIIFILKIFKNIVVKRIKNLAYRTKTDFDDLLIKIIDSIGLPFYIFLSLYISFQFIDLLEIIEKIVSGVFFIVLAYYIIKAIQKIIDYGINRVSQKMEQSEGKGMDPHILDILSKVIKGFLWVGAIIILLQNFGYNVNTLIAGLGIGGLAIAFALQSILEDIFSSFSIYFDRPFKIGDYIVIGEDNGIVKKIGIKSTRIQTLQGEELVMSNKELTQKRIRNFKKMEKRRIVFNFGVIYEISTEKLRKIPKIIREIVAGERLAELDRVHFKEFGDSSLNFEVIYYINSKEYVDYMNTQQEINFTIKERFENEGIDMAYPTQTLYLNKSN